MLKLVSKGIFLGGIAIFCVFLFSGCVSTDLVKQMLKDIDDLKAENTQLKQDLKDVEGRLEGVEGLGKDTSAVPTAENHGTDIGKDMETLLADAEEVDAVPVENVPRPSAVTGEELYSRAQALYSDQRYREAVQLYNQAVLLNDSAEFQARCYYWIGECMYAQGAYERALESFAVVFVKYGTTAKASDALLKIGFTYYEMRNYNGARQALNEFIQRFPDHRAVPFAEERLRWMDNLESGDAPLER